VDGFAGALAQIIAAFIVDLGQIPG
jgi:hypothetical protein